MGYIATNPRYAKRAKNNMAYLLMASQVRGDDASGIAFVKDEKIFCYKDGVPASDLVVRPKYAEIIKGHNPKIMIGHTRAKTQGDAKDNNNNHPIVAGKLAMVHNGVIYNDKQIFTDFKLKRDGEVDSEAIVRLIQHFKKMNALNTRDAIIKTAKEVHGNMAIGVINALNERELHIMSSGNPAVLAYEKSSGIIYFASTEAILKEALYTGKQYMGFFFETDNQHDFIFRELAQNEAVRLTSEKITTYEVERFTSNYGQSYGYVNHQDEEWDYTRREWVKKKTVQQSLLPASKEKKPAYVAYTDAKQPIKKPSLYSTDDLERRLEALEELETNGALTIQEQNELTRINNMIVFRTMREEEEMEKEATEVDNAIADDIEKEFEAKADATKNKNDEPDQSIVVAEIVGDKTATTTATPSTPEMTEMVDSLKAKEDKDKKETVISHVKRVQKVRQITQAHKHMNADTGVIYNEYGMPIHSRYGNDEFYD
jgi:glucosamine 6-phosphate synthetase-like amidotransferase/phosphosugar isomerase protein